MGRKTPIAPDRAATKVKEILAIGTIASSSRFAELLDAGATALEPAVIDAAIALYAEGWIGRLFGRADHLDDAIIRYAEAHEHDIAECAFVAVGMRTGRGPSHARLQRLIGCIGGLLDAARASRQTVRQLITEYPEAVEGARAAQAIIEPRHLDSSPWAPILAVDGTADSLDSRCPISRARARRATGRSTGSSRRSCRCSARPTRRARSPR